MKINENPWTSMKIIENHEHVWDIFVLKKIRWVIFYILRTQTPRISVLQREINCLNRENKNRGFRGNMDFDLRNTSQSHIFYENLKWSYGHYEHFALDGFFQTHNEVQFLTKVLESIFQKVWDSFPGQYLMIWRNSCGKWCLKAGHYTESLALSGNPCPPPSL